MTQNKLHDKKHKILLTNVRLGELNKAISMAAVSLPIRSHL
jgi:hypothetical protein